MSMSHKQLSDLSVQYRGVVESIEPLSKHEAKKLEQIKQDINRLKDEISRLEKDEIITATYKVALLKEASLHESFCSELEEYQANQKRELAKLQKNIATVREQKSIIANQQGTTGTGENVERFERAALEVCEGINVQSQIYVKNLAELNTGKKDREIDKFKRLLVKIQSKHNEKLARAVSLVTASQPDEKRNPSVQQGSASTETMMKFLHDNLMKKQNAVLSNLGSMVDKKSALKVYADRQTLPEETKPWDSLSYAEIKASIAFALVTALDELNKTIKQNGKLEELDKSAAKVDAELRASEELLQSSIEAENKILKNRWGGWYYKIFSCFCNLDHQAKSLHSFFNETKRNVMTKVHDYREAILLSKGIVPEKEAAKDEKGEPVQQPTPTKRKHKHK